MLQYTLYQEWQSCSLWPRYLTKPLCVAHEGDFLAGNSGQAVWWRELLLCYSQLHGDGDVEESRAVGPSPGAVWLRVPKSALPHALRRSVMLLQRRFQGHRQWDQVGLAVDDGGRGSLRPHSSKSGVEEFRNLFISVELPLCSRNQICWLQIWSPSIAAT